ncbi:hypothetical protein F2P81_016710 [Scophthalmus maximus]|uniref:Uncharacterized protein n=1 Tax=Scophthalmus maximus TaxID=52904 RepID=A0A6A4SBF6_SCOMX|nr:hypothetical protein F2P81_016710 [Scophthalmus maximus]
MYQQQLHRFPRFSRSSSKWWLFFRTAITLLEMLWPMRDLWMCSMFHDKVLSLAVKYSAALCQTLRDASQSRCSDCLESEVSFESPTMRDTRTAKPNRRQ